VERSGGEGHGRGGWKALRGILSDSWIQKRLDDDAREVERKQALAASAFEKARELLRSWSPVVEGLLADVGTQRWGKRLFGRSWTIERQLPSDGYPRWQLKKRGGRQWYDLQPVCRMDEDFFLVIDWGQDRRMAPLDEGKIKELLWMAYNRGPTYEDD
jgi:hypothetical protein